MRNNEARQPQAGPQPAGGQPVRTCSCVLEEQNAAYAGTGGVSQNNREAGFAPAYRHTVTGQVARSMFADGSPAPVHLLEGLPQDWTQSGAGPGAGRRLHPAVQAGFVRHGRFFTREQAKRLIAGA
jgi:hypothetical protein